MPGCEAHWAQLLDANKKADEIPFDYSRKFFSTLVTDRHGHSRLIVKGDLSHVVSRCSHVCYHGHAIPMDKQAADSVSAIVVEMLQEGMKVIAVAQKGLGEQTGLLPSGENGMMLMGYLAFFNATVKPLKIRWRSQKAKGHAQDLDRGSGRYGNIHLPSCRHSLRHRPHRRRHRRADRSAAKFSRRKHQYLCRVCPRTEGAPGICAPAKRPYRWFSR